MAELLSERRLNETGLFDAAAVAKLLAKCRAGRAIGFGDNMAFIGVLSTMLLHEQFVEHPLRPAATPSRGRHRSAGEAGSTVSA